MNRRLLYGIASVVGLVAAYYAIPVGLGIISLGEICLYSPSGTNLCASSATAPIKVGLLTPGARIGLQPAAAKLCTKPGIRYAGTTAEGAKVCFTLTPDHSEWLEIGFRFVKASGCRQSTVDASTTGEKYFLGPGPLAGPARITLPGFTATIQGAQAVGVLGDSGICGNKTFRWSARRAPG